jgi:reverse gyrase
MAICKFCNNEFSDERLEIGYDYCLDDLCVIKGMDEKQREFRKEYTPALLHKCNYFWIKKSELSTLNTRADIIAGYGDQNE